METKYQDQYIDYILSTGYHELKEFRPAELGASELCMFTHTVDKIPARVFVSDKYSYAYVLLTDGTFIDGCFHQFTDGRIVLS